jgi:hypothetical protein
MGKTPIFHDGEFISDFDKEYVKKKIVKKGWTKIAGGIVMILFGIGTYLSTSAGIPGFSILRGWALIIGAILVIAGAVDFLSTSPKNIDAEMRKMNRKFYGIEEPDQTWECPYCKTLNLNTTNICQKCKHKLV